MTSPNVWIPRQLKTPLPVPMSHLVPVNCVNNRAKRWSCPGEPKRQTGVMKTVCKCFGFSIPAPGAGAKTLRERAQRGLLQSCTKLGDFSVVKYSMFEVQKPLRDGWQF